MTFSHRWAILLAMSFSLLCSGSARAQGSGDDSAQLKAQLEALQKQNQEMMSLISDLQRKVDANQKRSDAVINKLGSAAGVDVAAPKPHQPSLGKPDTDENFLLGVVPTVYTIGNSKLKFYGFLRLDSIYDSAAMGPTNLLPFFVRSPSTRAAAAFHADGNNDSFNEDVRLTRFGLDLEGGTVPLLFDAKVGGKIEMDWDSGVNSESRAVPRFRHAYLNLKWSEVSILAGQTWDVISPLMPMVNDHLVMWNAGNLGDRRPQFRATWEPELMGGKLSFRGMVGLSGAIQNADRDANGQLDGAESGYPIMEYRVGWAGPVWVEKQNLDIGFWGHWAQEDTETRIHGQNQFESFSYGMDLTVPIIKDLIWKSELWTGTNLPEVRGGILQGINNQGETIDSWGGWTELSYKPWTWLLSGVGYTLDNPDNNDLDFNVATVGRKQQNSSWYLSNTFYPGAGVSVKLNWINWRTQYEDLQDGLDNRVELIMQYNW